MSQALKLKLSVQLIIGLIIFAGQCIQVAEGQIVNRLQIVDYREAIGVLTTENDNNTGNFISQKTKSWWEVFDENWAFLSHSLEYTLVLAFAYTLVFLVGIFTNAVVVAVITLGSHIKKVTNYFILNLAVADLFVIISLPFTLISSVFKTWMLGSVMCKSVSYIQAVSVFTSVYSLVAISIDRCKAICHNSMSIGGCSYRQAKLFIGGIWLVAVVVHSPKLVINHLEKSDDDMSHEVCREHWHDPDLGKAYFLIVNLILGYIIPLLLISAANATIWWKVAHRKVPPQDEEGIRFSQSWLLMQRMHRKTKRGVGKTLCIATGTFFLAWLPCYILTTTMQLSPASSGNSGENGKDTGKKFLRELLPLAKLLAYYSSIFNPVFYSFFNAHFRKMGKSVLPSWVSENILRFGDNESRRQTLLVIKRMCAIDSKQSSLLNLSGYQVKQQCVDFIYQKFDTIRFIFQHESVFSGTSIISSLKSNSVSTERTGAAV